MRHQGGQRRFLAIALPIALSIAFPVSFVPAVAAAPPQPTVAVRRITPLVVILRRPGLRTYEEVTEEFMGRVRAAVRIVPARRRGRDSLLTWLNETKPDLVFAVGQTAYDLVSAAPTLQIVHAFVYQRQRSSHHGVPATPPPDQVFETFRLANPKLRHVAVLCSDETCPAALQSAPLAQRLGLRLTAIRATSATDAVSALRKLPGDVDGLWLVGDLSLLTPQVFQFAVGAQFRRRLLLMGATCQHVAQGALFALDDDPRHVGQHAAAIANHLLSDGNAATAFDPVQRRHAPRLCVNRTTAEHLGVDISSLRSRATELIE